MAEAVKAQDVRDALEEVPGLKLPDSLTDNKIRDEVRRKTALVLITRGATTLPGTGTNERDLVDDAVLRLAVCAIKRKLRPDEADFLRALSEEEAEVRRGITLIETSSPVTGTRIEVVGGAEDCDA